MTTHVQLFGKPIDLLDVPPLLTVTGELDGYTAGEQYEGRLQINNSVGNCQVYVLAGTTLPQDATVSVDQATKEVVIRWSPASPEITTELPNGDFEQGDIGWVKGDGWSIADGMGENDHRWSGEFRNFKGTSRILTEPKKLIDAEPVTVTGDFKQGDSSNYNVTGKAVVVWLDENSEEVGADYGNEIIEGSHGHWHPSTVTSRPRPRSVYMQAGMQVKRKRQNYPAFVDNFTWDFKYYKGHDGDDDFPIRLMVVDSLNRKAYWNGTLSEFSVYFTSEPYPYYFEDSMQAGVTGGDSRLVLSPNQFDSSRAGVSFLGASLTATATYGRYDHPGSEDEAAKAGVTFGTASWETVAAYGRYDHPGSPDDAATAGVSFLGMSFTAGAGYRTYDAPNDAKVEAGVTLLGVTLE